MQHATLPTPGRTATLGELFQHWQPLPVWLYALTLMAPLTLLTAIWLQPWVPPAYLLRDPLAVAQSVTDCCHSYYGAVSNLGVLIWGGTAAICLFTALVLFARSGLTQRVGFFAYAGVLTAILTLDDLFLLHDHVLPNYNVPEIAMYAGYGLIAAGFMVLFLRQILHEDIVAFGAAGLLLATSIMIDFIIHSDTPIRIVIEDGAKLCGICLWAAFHITAATRALLATEPNAQIIHHG